VKSYVRIYADDGESHLEDVQIAYYEADFVPPAPPVSMTSFQPANQLACSGEERSGNAGDIASATHRWSMNSRWATQRRDRES
jgi:hypothetical protein